MDIDKTENDKIDEDSLHDTSINEMIRMTLPEQPLSSKC